MDKTQQGLQREQLLPGLPDDLVLQNVVPRLPYYARARAESLSRSWRHMFLQQESDREDQQRRRLALVRHRGLLLSVSGKLTFLGFADMDSHPLPPLPFAHDRARGPSYAYVFCANGRIFAFHCKSEETLACSVQSLYMLDVAAGLFRWQQQFGPHLRLHRRHAGDARGAVQVSSPYRCTVVGCRIYVIAKHLPPSLYNADKSQAIRHFTKSTHGIAAAMYDANEDTWKEIPSPLGDSYTAELVDLGSFHRAVIAQVYVSQSHCYHDNSSPLVYVHTRKQWCDLSKVTDEEWRVLAFPSRSHIPFSIFAKDAKAVCTRCGAPAIRSETLTYCKPLYKACCCHAKPPPGVKNALMASLSKLGWSFPLRSTYAESDESTDDEEETDESDQAI